MITPTKPFFGSKPWAIVPCKFNDNTNEPQDLGFFRNWIARGSGGVNDYFHDISYGNCNLDGSVVFGTTTSGWFELPYSKADDAKNTRTDRIKNAAMFVQREVDFTPFYGICIINNVNVDTGAPGPSVDTVMLNGYSKDYGLVVLDPSAWDPSVACHEFAHAFNLNAHSRNTRRPTMDYGNYFDLMSTKLAYMFRDKNWGLSGPGMNSPNLDQFGWIDDSRILRVPTAEIHQSLGINWTTKQTFPISLSALNHPEIEGALCATIEAKSAALGSFTYYLEYRCADGWDRGIGDLNNLVAPPNDLGGPNNLLIEQQRSDNYNYLVGSAVHSLKTGDTFHDADTDITIAVQSFHDHVATLDVTLPVVHVYKTPEAGPHHVDWHIYEELDQQMHLAERALENMRGIFRMLEKPRLAPIIK